MIKKVFLITILIFLAYGFWISPNFKEISAGVAIFLFGMLFMQEGFKAFTGGALESILSKFTNKTYKSLFLGFSAATIMQSSSLVSVLTISFLSAELITLVQGIGIIFGANLGTTTGAWLIAAFGMKVNIAAYAMPMLVFGVIFAFQKSKTLKGLGSILAGLGFLFLGIFYMKSGFESFQSTINLMDYAMEGFLGILTYVGVGIIATIVMQSSHATIILVIAALATGQVSYENSLALVIGANIGTTITAILGSLTSNINGKRLALSDVIFKTTTGIFFIIFLSQISGFIDITSNFIGIGEDNYTLKLALFHTLFNISGIILVIPFIKKLIPILEKVFPNKEEKNYYGKKYLNDSALELPSTAIISLTKESKNLFKNIKSSLFEIVSLKNEDIDGKIDFEKLKKNIEIKDIEEIDKIYNQKIKNLYGDIIDFASKAQSENSDKYNNNFSSLKIANRNLVEVLKGFKHLQKNLSKYIKNSNIEIRKQYENILEDIITLLIKIEKLDNIKDTKEKLIILAEIELNIENNDVLKNGVIDKLIRQNKITNQMATSLINDSYYKNEILKSLLKSSQIIFNNYIKDETTEIKEKKLKHSGVDIFGLSNKKLEKEIKKLKNKKYNLNQKLKKSENKDKKEILDEIEKIDLVIEKYKI